jgi:uncharacterized protein YecT (DUF1311 family)
MATQQQSTPLRTPRHLARIISLAAVASVGIAGWAGSAGAQEPTIPGATMAKFRACLATSANEKDCSAIIYDTCQASHDQPDTTLSITECTMLSHKGWDMILNERYRALMAASPAGLKIKLRAAQQAWIATRDADCAAIYEANKEGTIRGPLFAFCMVEHTADRASWLNSFNEN